jgi:hypothetical protein
MGVHLYWDYRFRDPELEQTLAQDPEEHQGVSGLREGVMVRGGFCVSFSQISKFEPELYSLTYAQMMGIFCRRCWRFPDCYVTYAGVSSPNNTIVIRRRMLNAQLPPGVKERTDAFLAKYEGNKLELVKGLMGYRFGSLSESRDYYLRLAWDVYRHRALREYGAKIVVVEDSFTDFEWAAIRRRVESAERVKTERFGEDTFRASGCCTDYFSNVRTMTCTCDDFRHCGRNAGMHCKHLIAALQQCELWERHWGEDIPDMRPAPWDSAEWPERMWAPVMTMGRTMLRPSER